MSRRGESIDVELTTVGTRVAAADNLGTAWGWGVRTTVAEALPSV